jgi:single-strand DNA-binding protein
MANFNYAKTVAVGNLGADPEINYTSGGKPIVTFKIGVTESWKDKNTNEWKDSTEWYRVVKLQLSESFANSIRDNFKKGDVVFVEGKIKTRKWQDNNNVDQYTSELIADVIKLVESKSNSKLAQQSTATRSQTPPAQSSQFDAPVDTGSTVNPEDPFAGM